MTELSRTMVIQVTADEATLSAISSEAEESARWMDRLFRMLYADKRNFGWNQFGPGVEQIAVTGKNYHAFLTRNEDKDDKKGKKKLEWHVRGEALYPVFIAKYSTQKIPSSLPVTRLQLLSQRIATNWSNFLNNSIPRPKNGLPVFRPLTIYHVPIKDFNIGSIKLNKTIKISIVQSKDKQYEERMKLLMSSVLKKTWTAIEIKKHNDGKWYAHIPYTIKVEKPISPARVMGIDRGISNAFVGAVVSSKTELPSKSIKIRGLPAVQRMERVKSRIRGLRSKADKGNKNARRKLKELKGKRRNIQDTLIHTAVSRIVKMAKAEGSGALVVEDLSSRFRTDKSRKMNRLVSGWGRGRSRDALEWKAQENGLRFKEVNPAETSKTCPKCGSKDKRNRDFTTHTYKCRDCGYTQNDDVVGAINIARRGWNYFHSPKWAKPSQSTPTAEGAPFGARGEDSTGVAPGTGDTFKPHSKQTDRAGPVTSNGACPQADGNIGSESPLKPTIGTADSDGYAATSRQKVRPEPETIPENVAIEGNESHSDINPKMGPLASTVRGPSNEPSPSTTPHKEGTSRMDHLEGI